MQRISARKRGYSGEWDRASRLYRAKHPLCIGCHAQGRVEPATVVDHIIPHKGDADLFWTEANLQSSCAWHHDAVKQQLEHMYLLKQISAADLRLDSAKALQVAGATPRKAAIGADGWPVG